MKIGQKIADLINQLIAFLLLSVVGFLLFAYYDITGLAMFAIIVLLVVILAKLSTLTRI